MAEYIRDTFTRTVASGWGTGEVGGAWTEALTNATSGVVANTQARITLPGNTTASQADERIPGTASQRDTIAALRFRVDAAWLTPGTWAGLSVWHWLRVSGPAASPVGYYARCAVKGDGSIRLSVGYAITGPIVELAAITYPVGTVVASTQWNFEAQATGAPSKVRARIYPVPGTPPAGSAGWLTAADDAGPQVAGAWAVRVDRAAPPVAAGQVADVYEYFASDPPVPDFTYTASGLGATFATTGTTGDFTAYSWSWGDGTTAGTGATPSHTYAAGGTYLVTLTGTTRWGSTFSGSGYVAVAAPPPEPPDLLPSVKIAGVEVCDSVYSVTWNLGRSSWFDAFTGQTCSIRLRGIFSAAPGQSVAIAVPNAVSGASLWVGTIDGVSEANVPVNARDETLITAMDLASRLARRHLDKGSILGTKQLPDRLEDLRPSSSVKFRYRYSAAVAAGRWLQLKLKVKADKLAERTYLDMVSDALYASFAFGYSSRDGVISYAPIEAPPGLPSTPRIDLNTGIDCASRITLDRNNLAGLINRWTAASDVSGTSVEFEIANVPSIETFGERAYSVPNDVLTSPDLFPSAFARFWDGGSQGMYVSLADPVRGAEVEVPVIDWAQKVITASPLDFATWNSKVYSIVGIRHEVTVGDAWRCTLNLDRNPWEMDGRAVP